MIRLVDTHELKNLVECGWNAGLCFLMRYGRSAAVRCCIILALLPGGMNVSAVGQPPVKARSARDGVMDQLRLQDGTVLLGMAVVETPPQLLVRTAWLQAKHAELVTARIQPELKRHSELRFRELRELLERERDAVGAAGPGGPEAIQRASLLQEVLERLDAEAPPLPRWVVFQAARPRFRSGELQTVQRREVCRMAFLQAIADVEEREWKSLVKELQMIQTLPTVALPDLTAEANAPSAEALRDQILAAMDVRLNAVTSLIQTGGVFVDEGQRPDPGALIQMALNQNLEGTLQELLNEVAGAPLKSKPEPEEALEEAFRAAERKSHRTLLISDLNFDLNAGTALVRRRLYFRGSEKRWNLVHQVGGSASVRDVQPDQIQPLENDPQIQQIAALVQGLGIDNGQMQTALKMGTVVQAAQNNSKLSFEAAIQDVLTGRFESRGGVLRIEDGP
jgi:hypothetical protein